MRFSGVSIATGSIAFGIFMYNRRENRADKSVVEYRTLGVANSISLCRGMLLSLLAGAAAVGDIASLGWFPASLYTAAIIADFFDGLAARLTKRPTKLGAILDMEYDALGVLVVSVVIARVGILGYWFLIVGAARYLFVFGTYLRKRLDRPVRPFVSTAAGRIIAGLQMGYMSAALWPIIPITYRIVAGYVFTTFFMAGFLKDWLVVSRAIDPASAAYNRISSVLNKAVAPVVCIAGRLAVAATFMLHIKLFDSKMNPMSAVSTAAAGVLVALTVTGTGGRASALGLLMIVIFASGAVQPDIAIYLLEVSALIILILGTGPFSIASPESRLFARE